MFDAAVRGAGGGEELADLLSTFESKIDVDETFRNKVAAFVEEVETANEGVNDERFMMRYQTYATRNKTPSEVFSKLCAAFKAADASDLIVGVNFVGPENGVTAIADYLIHMEMFSYLKRKFPNMQPSRGMCTTASIIRSCQRKI